MNVGFSYFKSSVANVCFWIRSFFTLRIRTKNIQLLQLVHPKLLNLPFNGENVATPLKYVFFINKSTLTFCSKQSFFYSFSLYSCFYKDKSFLNIHEQFALKESFKAAVFWEFNFNQNPYYVLAFVNNLLLRLYIDTSWFIPCPNFTFSNSNFS